MTREMLWLDEDPAPDAPLDDAIDTSLPQAQSWEDQFGGYILFLFLVEAAIAIGGAIQ